MKRKAGGGLFLMMILLACDGCSYNVAETKAERSTYYWKSVWKLSSFEVETLDSLHISTIYLKLFDVDWDEISAEAKPTARLLITDGIPKNYRLIPTVFITKESLQKTDTAQIDKLAKNIVKLIILTCNKYKTGSLTEIQIDCDWTASTKEKYFSLLKSIKDTAAGIAISATIRLHQVKFMGQSGVPPVDRGMLMCYNMGNLKNYATKNSIIDPAELKKFIGNLSAYPLQLDLALPIFEWKVLFRKNAYKGLIQSLPDDALSTSFCIKYANRSELLKDTLLNGYTLKKGDVLRSEKSDLQEVLAAANDIRDHMKNPPQRVSLYHLDSVTLSKYTPHELESIYSIFR